MPMVTLARKLRSIGLDDNQPNNRFSTLPALDFLLDRSINESQELQKFYQLCLYIIPILWAKFLSGTNISIAIVENCSQMHARLLAGLIIAIQTREYNQVNPPAPLNLSRRSPVPKIPPKVFFIARFHHLYLQSSRG